MTKIKYRFKSDEEEYMSEEAKKSYRLMNNLKQQLEWVKRQLEYISY